MKGDGVLFQVPLLLALFTPAVWAQPSTDPMLDGVTQAAQAGHLDQALQTMNQVLRDHPQNGRAHFIEAELLLQQGRIGPARAQLAEAERIAPSLPFASSNAAEHLRTALSSGHELRAAESGSRSHSLIWKVLLAIGSGAIAAWLLMRPVRDQ